MLGSFVQLRSCHNYFCSETTNTHTHQREDLPIIGPKSTVTPRRVLIVEFRDEVFAGLKGMLEDRGYEVARAPTGAAVAAQVNRFAPDLVVVNEVMPDESGGLIICKMKLTQLRQPVWLYAAQATRPDVKKYWGVHEVIAYGGVLSQLVLRVREQLECWVDRVSVNRGYTRHRGVADPAA